MSALYTHLSGVSALYTHSACLSAFYIHYAFARCVSSLYSPSLSALCIHSLAVSVLYNHSFGVSAFHTNLTGLLSLHTQSLTWCAISLYSPTERVSFCIPSPNVSLSVLTNPACQFLSSFTERVIVCPHSPSVSVSVLTHRACQWSKKARYQHYIYAPLSQATLVARIAGILPALRYRFRFVNLSLAELPFLSRINKGN